MSFRYDNVDYNYDSRRPPILPEYDYNGYNFGEPSRSGPSYGGEERGVENYSQANRSFEDASNYDYGSSASFFENPMDADRFRGPSSSSSFHMIANSSRPSVPPYGHNSHRHNFVPSDMERENGSIWLDRHESRMFEPSATWKQIHRDRDNLSHLSAGSQHMNGRELERRHGDSWRPPRHARLYDDYRPNYYPGQSNYYPRDSQSVYTDMRYIDEARYDSYRPTNRPLNARPSALGDYKLQQRQASRRHVFPAEIPDSTYKAPNTSEVDISSRSGNGQKLLSRGKQIGFKNNVSPPGHRNSSDTFTSHKFSDRLSCAPSDSGSEISDSDASSFSVGSSIKTSQSSRSRARITRQIHASKSPPASAANEYSKDSSHNIPGHTKLKSSSNVVLDNVKITSDHLESPTRSSQQTEIESSITRVDMEENSTLVFEEISKHQDPHKRPDVSEIASDVGIASHPKDKPITSVELGLHNISGLNDENEIIAIMPDVADEVEPMARFTRSYIQNDTSSQVNLPGLSPFLSRHAPIINGALNKEKSNGNDEETLEYNFHSLAPANDSRKALQAAISARRKYDTQTREQRVNPILIANLSFAVKPNTRPSNKSEDFVREVVEKTCSAVDFNELRPSLASKFHERRAFLSEKVQRLKEEYLVLNEHWLNHCAKLDSAVKAGAMEETIPNLGRTTRRSAANLGDAVRSDLEMERIIASLGNEDLTDPNHLAVRNVATVPDMISVQNVKAESFFDDTNGLVDDPQTFYDTRSGFYDWTPREEQIFLEKYGEFPKQFGVVSQYLPHKTTAQCVLYYYLHKKRLIDFRNAANMTSGRRRKGSRKSGKQKSNALLADIQERDNKKSDRGGRRKQKILSATNGILTSESTPLEATPELESRPKRRRINTSSSKIVELEASTSEAPRERKKPGRKPKKAKFMAVENASNSSVPETKFIDVNETLGRRKFPTATSSWSVPDKEEFLVLLTKHGKNFKRIAASMPNKTTIQVSNYYKTHAVELNLDEIAANAQSRSSSAEPIVHDPFVHGSHIIRPLSVTSLDGPLSGTVEAFDSNADFASLDVEKNVTSDSYSDLTGHQHIWSSEQNSQMHYRASSEAVQPQHRYMSILHPSIQGQPGAILSPQIGPQISVGSSIHLPSIAPTTQFSTYPPALLTPMSLDKLCPISDSDSESDSESDDME